MGGLVIVSAYGLPNGRAQSRRVSGVDLKPFVRLPGLDKRQEFHQGLADSVKANAKLGDCNGCQGKLSKRQNRDRELGDTHQSCSELRYAKPSRGKLSDGNNPLRLELFPVAFPTGDNVNKWQAKQRHL